LKGQISHGNLKKIKNVNLNQHLGIGLSLQVRFKLLSLFYKSRIRIFNKTLLLFVEKNVILRQEEIIMRLINKGMEKC
jgi:hypothetical protein